MRILDYYILKETGWDLGFGDIYDKEGNTIGKMDRKIISLRAKITVKDEKNDLTLVASAKEYSVPYGLCKLNSDGYLNEIIEKPKYDFLVNTGFYVVNPKVISLIPLNKFFNTNDFISLLKLKKKRVGVFPIDGKNWRDVGEWPQYKKTVSKL